MCRMMKRSPRSSNPRRRRKQVTFNETANIKQIIQHHGHSSDDDDVPPPSKEYYWYQEEDYQRMKDECKQLAETMSSCFHIDVLRSSGLETSEAKRERCCTMSDFQWIVLDEQHQLLAKRMGQRRHNHHHDHHNNNNQEEGGGNTTTTAVDDDDTCHESIATITSSLTKEHVHDAIKRGIISRQEVLFDDLERQYNESHYDDDDDDHDHEELMIAISTTKPHSTESSSPPPLREAEQSWSSITSCPEELDGSTQSLLLKSPLPRAA